MGWMFVAALKILSLTFVICSLSEGILYLLVYRTEDYKRKVARFNDIVRKLDKEKNAIVTYDRKKTQEKKINNLEQSLKTASADLNRSKMKKQVVAKLPFVPIKWLWGMTHRNLEGDDYTDCSFVFLYTLSSMFLKALISKFIGTAPPRTSLDVFQEANKKGEEE